MEREGEEKKSAAEFGGCPRGGIWPLGGGGIGRTALGRNEAAWACWLDHGRVRDTKTRSMT